jgi:hypothetical protein
MRALMLAFAALVVADVATTLVGFALGAVEGNPLGFGLALTLKVGAVALITVGMWRMRDPFVTLCASVTLVPLALPVIWNLSQLATLR